MKKFMILCAALLLPLQAFAAQSTYSVVISAVSYEGDVLKVSTQNNLQTGCAVNDDSNTLWVSPSTVQKVVAGITMSAHQDRRQAILYYDAASCDADGVTVVGAALRADPNTEMPDTFGANYGLIEKKVLSNNQTYKNTSASAQRLIFSGIDPEVRAQNTSCNFSFILGDSRGTHTIKSVSNGAGSCNVAQTTFNLAPNMTLKFQDHIAPAIKAQVLVFGVK